MNRTMAICMDTNHGVGQGDWGMYYRIALCARLIEIVRNNGVQQWIPALKQTIHTPLLNHVARLRHCIVQLPSVPSVKGVAVQLNSMTTTIVSALVRPLPDLPSNGDLSHSYRSVANTNRALTRGDGLSSKRFSEPARHVGFWLTSYSKTWAKSRHNRRSGAVPFSKCPESAKFSATSDRSLTCENACGATHVATASTQLTLLAINMCAIVGVTNFVGRHRNSVSKNCHAEMR
jgi:hypothetical protein